MAKRDRTDRRGFGLKDVTPIGDGKCPQAIDSKGVAGEVTVAEMSGLRMVGGSNELTNCEAGRGALPPVFV